MKNVNSFWIKTREPKVIEVQKSLTVPDMSLNLADILLDGSIDTISEKMRKRMIYGKRSTFNDLTQLDYYKGKLEHYENLIKKQFVKLENNEVNTEVNTEVEHEKVEAES